MKQVSANFGVVKDAVYNYTGKMMVTEGSKAPELLKTFFNEVKEKPIFKIQHIIFQNLENGHFATERLAERYISQNLKLLENYNYNDIVKENKSIKHRIMGDYEAVFTVGKEQLYESIHTLIKSVTQKPFLDIDKSQEAYEYIVSHLMRDIPQVNNTINETTDHPKFLSWRYVTDLAVNKFNESYNHLSDDEKSLLKILLQPEENKKNYLKDIKEENTIIIKNLLAESTEKVVIDALNKFSSKMENIPDTNLHESELNDAIMNLFELNESLRNVTA